MNDTLVLDKNYVPVSFVKWTQAVKLWYENRAIIIKEDDLKQVHSPSFTMGMPRIIVVKNAWVRRKRTHVPPTRRNFYVRDEASCQYCGRQVTTQEFTLDHVVPKSKGGLATWLNLVVACWRCNKRKANHTLKESGMTLIRQPFEPKANDPRYNFKLRINKIRPEWSEYLHWLNAEKASWSYWNVEIDPT
jgi:5-methylcytosine-specific restriction endonuclease McrA